MTLQRTAREVLLETAKMLRDPSRIFVDKLAQIDRVVFQFFPERGDLRAAASRPSLST